jgi:hypothetical protein
MAPAPAGIPTPRSTSPGRHPRLQWQRLHGRLVVGGREIDGEELPTGDVHGRALAGAAAAPGALLLEPCEHPCTGLAPGRTKAAAYIQLQVRPSSLAYLV